MLLDLGHPVDLLSKDPFLAHSLVVAYVSLVAGSMLHALAANHIVLLIRHDLVRIDGVLLKDLQRAVLIVIGEV